MLLSYKRSQASVVFRVKILDSSATDGSGLTGLAYDTASLIISTIADNEATATAYTVTGSTIETISTLGTYAAPTATKCRFKEVDATNHPGVYEIQLADARFAVASAKSLIVSISGAADCAETDVLIPLVDLDPYNATPAANVTKWNGTAIASPDTAGYPKVTLKDGTGAGEIALTSGNVKADLQQIAGSSTVGGVTIAKMFASLQAVGYGVTSVSGNTVTFKDPDGVTTRVTVVVNDTTEGERDTSTVA